MHEMSLGPAQDLESTTSTLATTIDTAGDFDTAANYREMCSTGLLGSSCELGSTGKLDSDFNCSGQLGSTCEVDRAESEYESEGEGEGQREVSEETSERPSFTVPPPPTPTPTPVPPPQASSFVGWRGSNLRGSDLTDSDLLCADFDITALPKRYSSSLVLANGADAIKVKYNFDNFVDSSDHDAVLCGEGGQAVNVSGGADFDNEMANGVFELDDVALIPTGSTTTSTAAFATADAAAATQAAMRDTHEWLDTVGARVWVGG